MTTETAHDAEPSPNPAGGMGAVLTDKRHYRRDCKDIVRILQFNGVLSESEVTTLLRAAAPLAAQSAKAGAVREYRAAMSVLFMAARIEQGVDQQQIVPMQQTNVVINANSGTTVESARTELLGIIASLRIAQAGRADNVVDQSP